MYHNSPKCYLAICLMRCASIARTDHGKGSDVLKPSRLNFPGKYLNRRAFFPRGNDKHHFAELLVKRLESWYLNWVWHVRKYVHIYLLRLTRIENNFMMKNIYFCWIFIYTATRLFIVHYLKCLLCLIVLCKKQETSDTCCQLKKWKC